MVVRTHQLAHHLHLPVAGFITQRPPASSQLAGPLGFFLSGLGGGEGFPLPAMWYSIYPFDNDARQIGNVT